MRKLISKQVDIYQFPSVDLIDKGTQITIGDLHGNAMKLMFMLVTHGIATNINKEDYENLVKIYSIQAENLTKEHLGDFNKILAKIEFNSDSTIRLIGDELADRGNNDYFTLKILEKLHDHKVPVEIIVSNHSIEFIEASEKQKDFRAPMLNNEHALSMKNLQTLVEKGIVEREEILKIAKKAYKPTLRAISYSLSEDDKEITIYSHAGIGLNTIKKLASHLKVNYKDTTALDLALTIQNINEKFQKHVQNNTVNTLYTRAKMNEGYRGYSDLSNAPFEFIMWNRLYNKIDRPAVHSGYNVNFVHGHDSSDLTRDNIYNLDNTLGKEAQANRGTYTVLSCKNERTLQFQSTFGINLKADQSASKNVSVTVGLFAAAGLVIGTGIGVILVATGVFALFGIGMLGAVAAVATIGGGLAFISGALGFGAAKFMEPSVMVSPDVDIALEDRGGTLALAGLGPRVERPEPQNMGQNTSKEPEHPLDELDPQIAEENSTSFSLLRA